MTIPWLLDLDSLICSAKELKVLSLSQSFSAGEQYHHALLQVE
jgi:hypothetical protein